MNFSPQAWAQHFKELSKKKKQGQTFTIKNNQSGGGLQDVVKVISPLENEIQKAKAVVKAKKRRKPTKKGKHNSTNGRTRKTKKRKTKYQSSNRSLRGRNILKTVRRKSRKPKRK